MSTETDAPGAVATTCPYCGVGCGVLATLQTNGATHVEGDPRHPANFGRLCSKGSALADTLGDQGRLLYPEVNGRRVSWDEALDAVAEGLRGVRDAYGPNSIAFYLSGQLLTEDYYVANKLMKGFIGSANVDTNSRLCMASSVAGHKRAFGSDTVPGNYADLDEADLIVLVGSNAAWCHPILFQRMMTAKRTRGARIVTIDPRGTATSEGADLHLGLAPGTDAILFNGLFSYLAAHGALDKKFIERHCNGFDAAVGAARADAISIAEVARRTRLDARDIEKFYNWFTMTERTVTCYSQGVNQSSSGTDKVNAIINCHLATGRIGRLGMGPFSLTGQPNAMGGREVGGLANQLAAHMGFDDPLAIDRVGRFWSAPDIARREGLKAVETFEAIADGRIRAVWIMATNPAVSMPHSSHIAEALKACPFVVVSDVADDTDTAKFAHVLLPAAAWAEKNGTVTNSERRISRQRGFLPLPGDAMPDWWHLAQVAKRMGFAGFEFTSAAGIFAEHAALSGFDNSGQRDFDISAHANITESQFSDLKPFQWPQKAGEAPQDRRFFAQGGFFTPDHRARMIATPIRNSGKNLTSQFPLWLNTGRIRDQWHTMTRTSKAYRLFGHYGEPFCEIHPDDAGHLSITPADVVHVRTAQGEGMFRALITTRQQRGSIFIPMHWTGNFASRALANAATSPMNDPVSGQPGLKSCAAALQRFHANWFGFAVSLNKPDCSDVDYWALARAKHGFRLELADSKPVADWQKFAAALFAASPNTQWLVYSDAAYSTVRLAAFDDGSLTSALFISTEPVQVARNHIASMLGMQMKPQERIQILAGQAGAGQVDNGDILCSCFEIGSAEIVRTIRSGEATSVDSIGKLLKAGTNCGSCRSEMRRLIEATALASAA